MGEHEATRISDARRGRAVSVIEGDGQLAVDSRPARVVQAAERSATAPLQLSRWTALLVAADIVAIGAALAAVVVARFGTDTSVLPIVYRAMSVALIPAWLLAMLLAGSYDSDYIAAGAEQYRRVLNGGVWLLAFVAFVSFAFRADVSRVFVLVSIPVATTFTIAGRFALRKALHHCFAQGRSTHRLIAIGSLAEIEDLVRHVHRAAFAGFKIVGALIPDSSEPPFLPADVAWAGPDVADVTRVAAQFGADTLAVAGSHALPRGELRRLSWALEGTDIQLLLAPGMTDLAGPRILMRPIDGLPLLHIEKPQFTGTRRFVKGSIDRVVATLLLTLLSPFMLAIAIAVAVTSRGPVIFRQRRVGLGGRQFRLLKFRTMRVDAEDARASLEHLNEHLGVLFKIRRDPRLTRIGPFLRRYSLDELPQLLNVLKGQMSLVGPRPPLPSEVERYGGDVHRRLLVKPGLTGMWQVSGRADLSWEESVRLDLYYVDHWSVGLDLVLLGKTFLTVLRGRGAY